MDKDIRNKSYSTKSSCHNVEIKEDTLIMRTLEKLQSQQAEHQANMQSMFQQFTQALLGVGSQAGPPRQKYNNANFCWYHNSDSHTISKCTTFHNLEATAKMEILRKNYICFHCVGMGHGSKDCFEKRTCYMKFKKNGNVCGKPLHPKLHYLLYQNNSNEVNLHTNKSDTSTLLMIGQVNCKDEPASGSSSTLVTHQKARDLGLCTI